MVPIVPLKAPSILWSDPEAMILERSPLPQDVQAYLQKTVPEAAAQA